MTTTFEFTGVPVATMPPAADLCRISGYLTDHMGRPLKGFKVRVISNDSPIVTPNQGVFGQAADVRTDSEGLVQFDIYKTAEVDIVFGDFAEQRRTITAPDEATADLFDLCFAYLVSLQVAVEDDELEVGEATAVSVTGLLSDGQELPVTSYCTLSSSDEGVLTVGCGSAIAVGEGTAEVSVYSVDTETLAESPPSGYQDTFQDTRQRVFVRKDAPEVDLGNPVSVTVS